MLKAIELSHWLMMRPGRRINRIGEPEQNSLLRHKGVWILIEIRNVHCSSHQISKLMKYPILY